MRHFTPIALAALLAGLAWPARAAPAQSPPQSMLTDDPAIVHYRIVAGDTLFNLGRRYFLNNAGIAVVQRRNHIADPYHIPIGTVITVPVVLLRSEPLLAHIAAVHGDVRVSRAAAVTTGMPIGAGTTVETGLDGFLTIELPNGSRTSLPTRSRLTVLILHRVLLTGRIDYDLEVSDGKAQTDVVPFPAGSGEFRIRTPRAVSAVRGTRFRVGYGGDQSETEVLDGTVGVGSGDTLSQTVAKAIGATISNRGAIAKEPLLPAPQLRGSGKVQTEPDIHLQFDPVPGAVQYHVLIAQDSAFLHVVYEASAARPEFSIPGLANGQWFVRSSAIAPSRLQGLEQSFPLRRALTTLTASAAGDAGTMRFTWGGQGDGRRLYQFQLLRNSVATVPLVNEPGLETSGIVLHDLPPGVYFWRVGLHQIADDGASDRWTRFERFTIAAPGG